LLFNPPSSQPSTAANTEGIRETMFEPERAVFARRRVRLALGVGEERREPLVGFERRSDRGGLSSGDSSLAEQRRVTCRGSTTHKL